MNLVAHAFLILSCLTWLSPLACEPGTSPEYPADHVEQPAEDPAEPPPFTECDPDLPVWCNVDAGTSP